MTTLTKTYPLAGWDLSELLPETTESVIAQRLAAIDAAATEFEGRREILNPEMEPGLLVETVQKVEALTEMVYRLGGFASLWFSADTQSQPALAFRNRIQQVMTGVQNRVLFFDLWWKSLSDDISTINELYILFLLKKKTTKPSKKRTICHYKATV